jgi:tetratricopeptide (TPR) repeat protein
LEQSLAIQKQIGDQLGASESLNNLGLVARDLGETHKAEQLLLESLAICEAIGARFKMASRLILVAFSYINNGKFTEGLARARLSLHIYHEMGYTGAWTAKSRLTIGAALICMGKYSEARIELEQALDIARENSSLQDIGMTLRHLGELALVEGRYAEAQEILTESLSVFDKIKYSQWRSHSNSLGYAARYQGEMAEAYNYLLHSLEQVIHSRNELMLAEFIPLAALLALDSGEIEQAIELYALASRYPLVANNRWFDDLVGNQIAAAAVTLPAPILQAAQQRGQSLDLWETAQGLVLELRNQLN